MTSQPAKQEARSQLSSLVRPFPWLFVPGEQYCVLRQEQGPTWQGAASKIDTRLQNRGIWNRKVDLMQSWEDLLCAMPGGHAAFHLGARSPEPGARSLLRPSSVACGP